MSNLEPAYNKTSTLPERTEITVRYEVARDVLNNMIAIVTGQIFAEQRKSMPDESALVELRATRQRYVDERSGLSSNDFDAIRYIYEHYAPIVKHHVSE